METVETKEVKCGNCGNEWTTRSQYVFVSCPSCLKKVKIREIGGK